MDGNESVQLNIKICDPDIRVIKENKFYMSLDRSVDFSISQKDDMVDEVLSGIRKISSR